MSLTADSEGRMTVMECCGLPMGWAEVFGIRVYRCAYRAHHPLIFVNLSTGEQITDEKLDWRAPERAE